SKYCSWRVNKNLPARPLVPHLQTMLFVIYILHTGWQDHHRISQVAKQRRFAGPGPWWREVLRLCCVFILAARTGDTTHACDLLVEPHVGQVLVEVMAWADLPALHVGAQRNDAVPIGHHHFVSLGVEHALLERAH